MATTLTAQQIAAIAAEHEAARASVQLTDPVTRRFPAVTLDDAYAIQAAWTDLQVAGGAVIKGHKVGLTSRAMQQAMKIDEPDFGTLFDYMFHPNGATLRAADYNDPKIEVELAFVLATPLTRTRDAPIAVDDVYAATATIVPALELIDARSHRIHPDDGRTRTVFDTISDNAANAGIIVGDTGVPIERVTDGTFEPRLATAIMKRNGIVEETGVAAGVLDDPARGVVWLANRLHGLGISLEAGETILAGSFTRPVDCRAGDVFHVDFGDLGVITLNFE